MIYNCVFSFISGLVDQFLGNQTHTDHFKLLKKDGSSLLIGARNVVYNLTLPSLSENTEQVSLKKKLFVTGWR